MDSAQKVIDEAWEGRASINASSAPRALREAVEHVIAGLDSGRLRVAEKSAGKWLTHQWLKKAVLLSFRLEDNRVIDGGATRYYDKVASKFATFDSETLQADPVIIEDNCFIGARSEVVEGVIVEENSVISMGVFLGQSTRILDRATGEILYGRVPAGSVVVSGSIPSPGGKYSLYCVVIVKKVDAKTRAKTSLNDLLRGD